MENSVTSNRNRAIKISFVIINIIYSGMALGLLIVGILALYDAASVNTDNVKPLLDAVKVDSFQVGTTVTILSTSLIIIAVLIWLVVGCSILWVCCKEHHMRVYYLEKIILVVYAVLVLVLLVTKIVIIAQWYKVKDKVEGSEMKNIMLNNLISVFKGDTTTNANSVSNAWNYVFMILDCCAVNAVTGTANDFDTTTWCTTSGSCQATSSQIPKTCCINVDENTYSSAPSGCHASVNPGTYNSKGCHDALKDKLLFYSDSISGVAITIIFIEVAAFIFALVYFKTHSTSAHSDPSS